MPPLMRPFPSQNLRSSGEHPTASHCVVGADSPESPVDAAAASLSFDARARTWRRDDDRRLTAARNRSRGEEAGATIIR